LRIAEGEFAEEVCGRGPAREVIGINGVKEFEVFAKGCESLAGPFTVS
jgi:hypothetical protein